LINNVFASVPLRTMKMPWSSADRFVSVGGFSGEPLREARLSLMAGLGCV
jgi:hypothetical protein